MKKICIEWKDHYSVYGWFSPEETVAVGHTNVSVGILVSKTNEHITLAQTMHKDGSQFAELLHILTKDVIKMEEFN